MDSFLSRFKNSLVLIAILLAQTIALATQINRPDPERTDGHQVRLVRLWANTLMLPFERGIAGSGHGIRNAWRNYIYLRDVRRQNQALTDEVAQLRLQRDALSEEALEGKRLETLYRFSQQYAAKTIAAQVIATSGSDSSRILTLDKGSRDGLKPDMPVITPDGIVGKLRDVFPFSSELLLINDPTSGAGVILQSTRIHAILRGSPQGRIVINNLTADSRVKPGEMVLTSGGDRVFPRGLPVGTIESIVPDVNNQPFTLITLKPAADINRLEEVLIITGTGPVNDAPDSAGGADIHAADVSAERLPSLHGSKPESLDPNAPDDTATPPPDNSPSLVPKPKPALHPDRYTPGTVPPATDLTPGSPKQPPPPTPL
jgi:rod shape-determining protein MreC